MVMQFEKKMEDYQSLLVLHIGIKWTLSVRIGIPGVTIPKGGFGDNELMLFWKTYRLVNNNVLRDWVADGK